jgi:pimeloyl-ACP methyl ester carboxylesterase
MGVSGPAHFVFVHGGGLGAWTWFRVVDFLRKKGHKATAIDLTSCGRDTIDPNTVSSFLDYNQPLVDFFNTLSSTDKVILVGHDLGGLSVTYAMEHFHQKIQAGVFLAAMMLPSGFPLTLELFELDPAVGRHIEYTFGDGINKMPTALYVMEKMQHQVFYHLCPSEDVVLASLLSKPVPLRMLDGSCIEFTEERYGTVPKVYIKTMKDRVLPPDAQDEAFLSDPACAPTEIREIESDHSPFFSKPVELVQHLEEIASNYA